MVVFMVTIGWWLIPVGLAVYWLARLAVLLAWWTLVGLGHLVALAVRTVGRGRRRRR